MKNVPADSRRLNEKELVHQAVESIAIEDVELVAQACCIPCLVAS